MEGVNPLAFYLLALVIALSGIMVVTLRNLFYSALSLILCFSGVAGLYLLLRAEFIAGIQVLIYVGAVAVLILFVIMLTPNLAKAKTQPDWTKRVINALGMFGFFFLLGLSLLLSTWKIRQPVHYFSIKELGKSLLTTYLLPFELLSLVLLAALIGALVVARKEEEK